ncbi:MAG TPA: thioredoxin TrxC [Bdellovibrionales bacterium]|nr:thioredoxin TrxC [Bdellovibrionales bacterium]
MFNGMSNSSEAELKDASSISICPSCRALNRVKVFATAPASCGKCKTELPFKQGISQLGAADLQALLQKSSLPIVVDFWAPWCGPCRSFAPVFQQAAELLSAHILFVKVDTQANPLSGDLYQIRSIPTLAFFSGGLERDRVSGALPLPEFLNWIEQQIGKA